MAKIDKSQYTKEEWRKVREQRRAEKEKARRDKALDQISEPQATLYEDRSPNLSDENKNYVLCLKHGTKYGSEYVNILHRMVKRNITLDYEMVCLTDDPRGIDPEVKILPLPSGLEGWWCKPYIFSKDLPIKGNILYMDLDVVISGNLDKLFEYHPNAWCVIRDFTRAMRPKWEKYNSSVIRFKTGQLQPVWEDFIKNPKSIIQRLHGDQDWLYERMGGTAIMWPDSWIQSWKWEVRTSREFKAGGIRGNRQFKHIEHVTPRVECCICVFHGDPNPHNCEDPWVKKNWQ